MNGEPLILKLKLTRNTLDPDGSDGKTAIDPMPWPVQSLFSPAGIDGGTKLTEVGRETTDDR